MNWIRITFLAGLLTQTAFSQTTNSLGITLADIPAGKFYMGSEGEGENADENPVHRVTVSKPFRMAITEITNAQFEAFDPSHKKFRGKDGFSKEDDEAVVFVSYRDATAFCEWLGKKEGKKYRLPTEAEWEYACRAGTVTDFSTGRFLSKAHLKSQKTDREQVIVSLKVGQAEANKFGLYDLHGNVEEWCSDWYGAYSAGEQKDPVGRISGLYRVTRGGSHGTPLTYLRSSNRMAMIPEDKHFQLGFRIVEGDLPVTKPLPAEPATFVYQNVSQKPFSWKKVSDTKPIFMEPIRYVNKPECTDEVPFFQHNHCPAITWCPNGDLLAAWFSTNQESGREMTILASRLRAGQQNWDKPSEFFNVPDRNMTGTSLFDDGKGTLYHMNGVETDGDWKNLAMVLRTSKDNGATWSIPSMADPEHQVRNQVIAGMSQTKEGWLVQAGDADPGPVGGTAIHVSKDGGKTWENPYPGKETPDFKEGRSGGLIAGIHAGVVQLKDGSLFALGRNNNIEAQEGSGFRMPASISKDMGKTWNYAASEFPPIAGGQRLILFRLNEGPLLVISFTHHPEETDEKKIGMTFKDSKGNSYKGYGMYAALSYDEGKTWPVKKLLTDKKERYLNGGAWTGAFEMDEKNAEPRGYLALTQSPDNLIHLISSSIHYRFNLNWLTAD
ncbi:Formylglycine-generating enzyme, required for sulfatase activity, contains SUMF1/FGE domain [Dyadobacter koreensis]|uniref:Formylglycine-generating enzyme, required for sulfatase activity, contains SUMF1/FGE domain n=1 Tax=Dyadobacter koreensis TaxID=408657 RepID=A0A1H6W6L2_9BACT|nr:SUMF1/EgtB/PvdO family nonheme iron enzyme [Dyadobacter koreensis]SEJ12629.1 Formylglycine-generating enzyme, required for sulfatase activity, contains SUMF1/FGE domain [Dyadobacter koreensis]